MYKIITAQYKQGAIDTMNLLNSMDLFDHLSEIEMKKVELKVIEVIEKVTGENSND